LFDGAFQSLESLALGDTTPWTNPDRLTFSFVPDGTRVSKYQSELYSKFSHFFTPAQIENQFIKAFQEWGRLTGVNVGLVADAGLTMGVSGAIQGDPRIGDIRIGAIPMSPDVYAITVRNDPLIAGTWAGDILINSNAEFDNLQQFYSVVLHETGHALGLQHSTAPKSVMFDGALNSAIIGVDVAAIRSLYGYRRIDSYDLTSNPNNSFDRSARIHNSGSLNGTIPLVVYGDIQTKTDVDYFDLQPLSGYTGPVRFELVSSGISLLRHKISVFDENENLIQTAKMSGGMRGGRLTLTLPTVLEGERYYVLVEPADDSLFSTGSYALVATLMDNVTIPSAQVEPVIKGNYWRLPQTDVQEIFLNPSDFFFNADLALNDNLGTAQSLKESPTFNKKMHYQIQASFSYIDDLDFFSIVAPGDLAVGSPLTVTLETMEEDRLVPDLQIYNANGEWLPSRTLINGNGQIVLQLDGVSNNQTIYLRASAEYAGDRFFSGNYNLVARFDRPSASMLSLGSGSLNTNSQQQQYHNLYVAEPQLLHLALSANSAADRSEAQVWVTIYDQMGRVIFRDLTVPGKTRTAKSVVVRPGSYSILVSLATSTNGSNPISLDYRLDGKGITDPIGPEILKPSERPFKKAGPNDPNYVYPGVRSPDAFVVTSGNNVPTPPGTVIPPNFVNANAWYWYNGWLVKEVPPLT
jgi:hypothetical protein